MPSRETTELQVTRDPCGHILTNTGVWSPDGRWIVYDTRSGADGSIFDGPSIERVNVETGEVQTLFSADRGAHCGVATYSPTEDKVVFILGPTHPTPDWSYGPSQRGGVIVNVERPEVAIPLDARDLVPPFTAGALRGGTHLHVFSPDGQWVAFTYEDHLLACPAPEAPADRDICQRNVGVSVPAGSVNVGGGHPRNQSGAFFSVLVTRTTRSPRPGSDEISRAYEEAWVGGNGYLRSDGTRQDRAIAFVGNVVASNGETVAEAFIADLPDDLTRIGDGPLQGTEHRAPFPPRGVAQRRLTFTSGRRYPGIQGPRHWLRSSPDGSRIALLMRDDGGLIQLWTVAPTGGIPIQLTHGRSPIASAFTWSPGGRRIAHVLDNRIVATSATTGVSAPLTDRFDDADAPRPQACVISPDGRSVAYVRPVECGGKKLNQIFVTRLFDDPA